jgi:hypothetical protein
MFMIRTFTLGRIALPFLFLFVFKLGTAQNYVGLSGGGGLATEVGFRTAAIGEFPVNSILSIQTEVVFIQRANWEIIQRLNQDIDYRQVVVAYIELPLLAKFSLDLNAISLHGLLGVKLGYGINMVGNYVEDGSIISEKFQFDEKNIEQFDMGLNLGFGIEREISKARKIFIDYRYYLGLYDIDKEADSEIYNAGSVVNMGFLIPIGGKK